jgi:hypothetical protein
VVLTTGAGYLRHPHVGDNFVQQGSGGYFPQPCFRPQYDSVCQNGLHQFFDIIGCHECSTRHGSLSLRGAVKGDASARTSTQGYIFVFAGAVNDFKQVPTHFVIHMDIPCGFLRRLPLGCAHHGLNLIDRVTFLQPPQQPLFVFQ